MNKTIAVSELSSRIKDLESEIRQIEDRYIPEHESRSERDSDWHIIRENWNRMIADRKFGISKIKEQIMSLLKEPVLD